MTMFSTGVDHKAQKWDGAKTPLRDVCDLFRADDAQTFKGLPYFLKSVAQKSPSKFPLYADLPASLTEHEGTHSSVSIARRTTFLKQMAFANKSENANEKEGTKLYRLYNEAGLLDATVKPLAPQVAKLRSIKSEAEQKVMKSAADISGRAHAKVMIKLNIYIPAAL